jgi:hypothetical protein
MSVNLNNLTVAVWMFCFVMLAALAGLLVWMWVFQSA